MLSGILTLVQLLVIAMYLFLLWRLRSSNDLHYKRGWRDGQLRFITLINEFMVRPDINPNDAYISAVTTALEEDPDVGKKHLPWYDPEPKKGN